VAQELNVDKALSDKLYKLTAQFGVRSVVACKSNMALSVYITAEEFCKTDMLISEIYSTYSLRLNVVDEVKEQGLYHIQLMEKPPIRISAYCEGAARTGSSISGDSFTYMDMGVRKYLLALADGMGSGEGARAESTASIELYEDFMEAGFDRETSVDIINSVLLMGEQRECYSTLDICTVDMYTGRAEFVKIGAVSSYLVRGNEVEKIGKGTLPVGVLSEVDSFVCERRLEKGDRLIMLTDGILSSTGLVMREDWLINTILKNKSKAPKTIAHSIMSIARGNCKGTISDDMTVLVASIY
jgi:stage II sporulation protein E